MLPKNTLKGVVMFDDPYGLGNEVLALVVCGAVITGVIMTLVLR